uniref:Uncharacterized protein n=1 Tax=Anguilla anguilla TaxID=7936 RepID=A0A0E9WSG4_ANGAN
MQLSPPPAFRCVRVIFLCVLKLNEYVLAYIRVCCLFATAAALWSLLFDRSLKGFP